jgi:uncharacterized damage-inducible protein DinB
MSLSETLTQEFDRECATTRKVLERVPSEKLSWKPHHKSMSLGTLAMHVATIPGFITGWALTDVMELGSFDGPPEPTSLSEVLAAHDESVQKTKATLAKLGDVGLMRDWKLTMKGGATIMGMPKVGLVRSVAFNHWYHHRGQLSVYLRLLDVPVPSIYGPSADENPLAVPAH